MKNESSASADDITVSIVSHGHGRLLLRLLNDLNAQSDMARVNIIFTLNIHEHVDLSPFENLQIKILTNASPKGFGANHNAAFAHCTTRWFLILNPDLRVFNAETFSCLAATASSITNLGVIAPQILSSQGSTEDAIRPNLSPFSLVRRWLGDRASLEPASVSRRGLPFYWLAGMCLMFDAAAYRSIGGFDDRIFLYCEDYDICARLYISGYTIAVDPYVNVVHDGQRTSHRSRRYLSWHLASLIRIWTKLPFWQIVFHR